MSTSTRAPWPSFGRAASRHFGGEAQDVLQAGARGTSLPRSMAAPRRKWSTRADLRQLPILTCWPDDGGPFITLPIVITHDPRTGARNCGMYRMQLLEPRTRNMHWQAHKTGMRISTNTRNAVRRCMVAVVLGGDPAVTTPLPRRCPTVSTSWYWPALRQRAGGVVRCKTIDMEVPARRRLRAGRLRRSLRRRRSTKSRMAITPASTPLDQYLRRSMSPVTRREQVNIGHCRGRTYGRRVAGKGLRNGAAAAADDAAGASELQPAGRACLQHGDRGARRRYPFHGRKIMHALWGMGQLMFTGDLVDKDVNVHDVAEVAARAEQHRSQARRHDLRRPYDVLDHGSCTVGAASSASTPRQVEGRGLRAQVAGGGGDVGGGAGARRPAVAQVGIR